MNNFSFFLLAQEGNNSNLLIGPNSNTNKIDRESVDTVKSYIHDYRNNETKMVRKLDSKPLEAENKTTLTVIENKNIPEISPNFSSYNPLSNFNQNTASKAVLKKMQMNKEANKDLFDEICLVYIFETGIDSGKTNFDNLLSAWQKQKAFIALNRMENNKYKLFLNAQFDTEHSEEIMTQNKLKVIFKEEFYSIYSVEK